MYKIEKQIPIPPGNGRDKVRKYPFNEMEIGDSFGIGSTGSAKVRYDAAAAYGSRLSLEHRIRVAASAYGSRHGMKFSVKTDSTGGYRCWRVS